MTLDVLLERIRASWAAPDPSCNSHLAGPGDDDDDDETPIGDPPDDDEGDDDDDEDDDEEPLQVSHVALQYRHGVRGRA